jgi:hypothetical protein
MNEDVTGRWWWRTRAWGTQAGLSDEDLVRRAQVDPDEFGDLYARYTGYLS